MMKEVRSHYEEVPIRLVITRIGILDEHLSQRPDIMKQKSFWQGPLDFLRANYQP